MHQHITISELCTIAEVSVSGYYKWISTSVLREKRLMQELRDLDLIKNIFESKNQTAGFRTVTMGLMYRYAVVMNHKKVIRIMNKYGLICKIRKKKTYGNTFDKNRIEHTYDNLLKTTFDCNQPYTVFHTDITYIKYSYGRKTAYLSAIKDEATREIVAYEIADTLEIPFVIKTVKQLDEIQINSNAIIHSDQGVHYTSNKYGNAVTEIGLTPSMSARGRCVDNAPIETFWGHMKDEINFNIIETYEDVIDVINKHIYNYNHSRPQWTLKKMTPIDYRNHLLNVS